MIIGNDIIDRSEAPPHPRFFARITSDYEKDHFEDNIENALILWAIKESAYKAFSQIDPMISGIARKYEVSSNLKQVKFDGQSLKVSLQKNRNYIYAEAYPENIASQFSIGPIGEISESLAAKSLAAKLLSSSSSSMVPPMVKKLGKIPFGYLDGRSIPLSLTHHGRFAAASIISS